MVFSFCFPFAAVSVVSLCTTCVQRQKDYFLKKLKVYLESRHTRKKILQLKRRVGNTTLSAHQRKSDVLFYLLNYSCLFHSLLYIQHLLRWRVYFICVVRAKQVMARSRQYLLHYRKYLEQHSYLESVVILDTKSDWFGLFWNILLLLQVLRSLKDQ